MSHESAQFNLKKFFVAVIFWMSCSFVFWYLLHDLIIQPAILISSLALESILPDVFDSLKLHKGNIVLITKLGELNGMIMSAKEAGNQIAYQINPKVLSYSLPFIVSLLLASSDEKTFKKIIIGIIILYPIIVMGTLFQSMKELFFGNALMHDFITQKVDFPLINEIIAIGYQFNTLIIPAVTPIIIWSWLENKKISSIANNK